MQWRGWETTNWEREWKEDVRGRGKVINKGMEEHKLGKGKDGGGQGKKESDNGGDGSS